MSTRLLILWISWTSNILLPPTPSLFFIAPTNLWRFRVYINSCNKFDSGFLPRKMESGIKIKKLLAQNSTWTGSHPSKIRLHFNCNSRRTPQQEDDKYAWPWSSVVFIKGCLFITYAMFMLQDLPGVLSKWSRAKYSLFTITISPAKGHLDTISTWIWSGT